MAECRWRVCVWRWLDILHQRWIKYCVTDIFGLTAHVLSKYPVSRFRPTPIGTRINERQTDIKTIYIIHRYLIIDNMIARQTCLINLIINKLLSHTIFRLRCFVLHWSKNSYISIAIGNQLLPFFFGQSARFTTMYHKSMVSIVDLLRGREGRRLSQPFKTP